MPTRGTILGFYVGGTPPKIPDDLVKTKLNDNHLKKQPKSSVFTSKYLSPSAFYAMHGHHQLPG